ncbi:hypothetical protein TNCV_2643161 [Trichonephila clavipes]|nr:hypothetical protein TNCV_2643161 [Trichonephila clavipes]
MKCPRPLKWNGGEMRISLSSEKTLYHKINWNHCRCRNAGHYHHPAGPRLAHRRPGGPGDHRHHHHRGPQSEKKKKAERMPRGYRSF